MWNSNSLIGWLLARSGHDTDRLEPPPLGRAPGWAAGLIVAARQADLIASRGPFHRGPTSPHREGAVLDDEGEESKEQTEGAQA